MKILLKLKEVKHRNFMAKELRSNPLYRSKVVVSKKVYNRKKMKPINKNYYD